MVLTHHVLSLAKPEHTVQHLSLEEGEELLAWAEKNRTFSIARMDGTGLVPVATVAIDHNVSFLMFHRTHLVVGDDLGHLFFYDHKGVLLETQDVDGGVQSCQAMGLKLVVLSGMGHLQLHQFERPSVNLSERFGLGDLLHFAASSSEIFIAEQSGLVLSLDEASIRWRRPQRGDHGERITHLGLTKGGAMFLSREGHALVAGDEEAIEFELWRDGALVLRSEQRMRLLTSSPATLGAVLGFDDGTVQLLQENGHAEVALTTKHPIFSCFEHRSSVIASSWFYIHGLTDGEEWKVEHQGMAQMLCCHSARNLVLFAGDDQNDYTDPEPIGCIDLNSPLVETDAAELSLWFQSTRAAEALTAEDLYENDGEDVLAHLTEEERASYGAAPSSEHPAASLLAAMGTANPSSSEDMTVLDEEGLMEALNSTEELSMEDTGELLDALSASVDEVIAPRAVAGDDQRQHAEEDGTCVVLLDGRGSYDPHDQISRWSWHDERGQELSETPQLKLKLPVGRHRFELRVVDRQGSWTTDSLVVHVIDGSTS
ncbi:MAG: hypothetical protein ACPGKR_00750 [Poseidonia sp.]